MLEALGIIETLGFTAAIQAADAAVKSANIRLAQWVKVGGGRVSIIIRGDVAAVKAAVDAGVQAASNIGNVLSEVIIPRPSDKISGKFPIEPLNLKKQ
ncbi:microcompartments protein [Melioribacter roseus P3M-2]|uniref:Microcompartments protein n=1 Tax=Melioribacter roseus (strain DSM 23840 / JCM 17771 / VKM B-2668 / P3M-2) TaxID=1191523 RepID=I6Z2H1_MELRP|nr:microcompartments protein [Melioribacter roseus P3M-2]